MTPGRLQAPEHARGTESPAGKEIQGQAPDAHMERLHQALVCWFQRVQRPLPWRGGYDPYQVWISEMMLQQTRVETMLPYFARWMERFPSVRRLAEAPLEDVLKVWEGLGYYARARSLHRAAREVETRHGGRLPEDVGGLRELPGIGPYTAGAIASIAFGRSEPAVDGNSGRVLSRLFALREPPGSPDGRRTLWQIAGELVEFGNAREMNQALMELGSLVCTPRAPHCEKCPVEGQCRATRTGEPEVYPDANPKLKRRRVRGALAVVERDGRLLVHQRPPEGLWGGLWEFPWRERSGAAKPGTALAELLGELGVLPAESDHPQTVELGGFHHDLTHFRLELDCFLVRGRTGGNENQFEPKNAAQQPARWLLPAEIDALPLGKPAKLALHLWHEFHKTPATAPTGHLTEQLQGFPPRKVLRKRA